MILRSGKDQIFGYMSGLLVFLVPLNVSILMPISLLVLWFSARRYCFYFASKTAFLILLFLVIMLLQIIFLKQNEIVIAMQYLVYPVILFLAFNIYIKKSFLIYFSYAVLTIFFIDYLFNLHVLFYGEDVLGRQINIRPGDFFHRLIGVYGHPFISIGIACSALLAALFLKKYWIVFLAITVLLMTGSLRGAVYMSSFLLAIVIVNIFSGKNTRFFLAILFGLAVIASVYVFSDLTSNNMRLLAWSHGLGEVMLSPVIGNSGYIPISKGVDDAIDFEQLVQSGNAEQQLLNLAIHYGIPVLIIFSLIIYSLGSDKKDLERDKHLWRVKNIAWFMIIADLFFGHIFTFYPFAMFSLLILISLRATNKIKYQ